MLGVRTALQKNILALLAALVLSVVAATTSTATAVQVQDGEESQWTDEQGFDKWGQLLGLAGLAGLASPRCNRSEHDNRNCGDDGGVEARRALSAVRVDRVPYVGWGA